MKTPFNPRTITAPRGTAISCKGWIQEAALRMLMNNLDAEVAEKPEELIVYGGVGKAARNWECYHALVRTLRELENDETLLVQSGKPVAVFKTHPDAPRVLISNSMLVPKWATWDEFRRLDAMGLTMYGQMTAGSWIYIGTQGILQGTYETFAAVADRYFGGTLAGRLLVTAGLGGMGGAQPLAATMNGAACLAVEVDRSRIERRLKTGYVDEMAVNLDEALLTLQTARELKEPRSVGLLGNAAEVLPELLARGISIDVLTDQTSAHDTLNGYVPAHIPYEEAIVLRTRDSGRYVQLARQSIAEHVHAMIGLQKKGAVTFDYGNNIRGEAKANGVANAFDIPGFVPEYIRPLFCDGKGPFRWAALSGEPEDIRRTDRALLEAFPENAALARWITKAQQLVHFQGLPARICWLGYGERARMGKIFNDLVARGELRAPIVIGRDHLDCGSVASPNRETEKMLDGSDAIADWPILNALLNTAGGASWVSVHHGGGVGMGLSLHAGMVVVADGTPEAADRLERVLTYDPGMGIVRHADAGYPRAVENAKRYGIRIPMDSGHTEEVFPDNTQRDEHQRRRNTMHGFGHIEIPTTNFKKAKKFFGTVFGWTFQDLPDINYVLFRAGQQPNGGFYFVKKMPKKGQVNVYIEVEDIDAKLKEIRKAKGKILVKRTDIGAMGWFAQFATPDGCYLSLWQSSATQPTAEPEVRP